MSLSNVNEGWNHVDVGSQLRGPEALQKNSLRALQKETVDLRVDLSKSENDCQALQEKLKQMKAEKDRVTARLSAHLQGILFHHTSIKY